MKLELQWGNYVPKLELGNEEDFTLFVSGYAGVRDVVKNRGRLSH